MASVLEPTRRRLLAALGVVPFAASAQDAFTVAGKRPMFIHSDFPEDLESPPEYFTTWLTPVDSFFVRQHLPRPKVQPTTHSISIGGMVTNKLALSIADLKKLPQYTVPATLECAGNGRGNFRPRIPGLQWTKGAIGNAEWRGPRVKDVLAKAAVTYGATYVDFDGADIGVGKTPDFIRSIPLRKAMHEATLLALDMNGQPLPELHGGPVRLIVPGWDGASWVKWVSTIQVSAQPHEGFYMKTAYKYPKYAVGPGGAAKPEDMEVIEGMAVKSFFAKPSGETKHKLGTPVSLAGVAWGGENRITRVEVSVDAGATWQNAAVSKQDFPFAWRLWNFDFKPTRPGYYTLCCRATDSAGRTQPIEAQWNPSGYLYNAIERIAVLVEA